MEANQAPVAEVLSFLDYTVNKSFLNEHTARSRKTACKNLFSILDDGQQTVGYVSENLDTIVHRFGNKFKDKFTGQTVELYKARVKNSLDDFKSWNENKAAWEKEIVNRSRQTSQPKETQAKTKGTASKKDQPEETYAANGATRKLSFPIRADFEVKMEIPVDGLSSAELKKLGAFLLPYCNDISSETWRSAEWGLGLNSKRIEE